MLYAKRLFMSGCGLLRNGSACRIRSRRVVWRLVHHAHRGSYLVEGGFGYLVGAAVTLG